MTSTPSLTASFHLPDFTSHCQFPLKYYENGDTIGEASAKWYESGCTDFTAEKHRHLVGLKAGLLTSYVYHDTDDEHLRVICDFMNYLFHLDDLSDGMLAKDTETLTNIVMNALAFPHSYHRTLENGRILPEQEPDASKLARDFWARCIKDAGPGFQTRFCANMELYFKSVSTQARDRDNGVIPELETYIESRRDNSGVFPLIDCLEYTLRIDLPSHVIDDPVVKILKQCVNDFIAWSNDIFSYNAENARGDTYNMVAILMRHHNLDLQDAVDQIADMCRQAIDTFCKSKEKLPSWGEDVDRDVARYVHGLENWIAGSLHWSFITERYFGPNLLDVKQTGVVKLLSKDRTPVNAN